MKKQRATRTPSPPKKRRTTPRSPAGVSSVLEVLQRNILFRDVNRSTITRSMKHFTEHAFRAGDLIFDEYSKGRELFLLCSGRVRIKKYTKFGVESLLAVLHPGDFFGEMSLIDGLPRSARADAMDDCLVLTLNAEKYRALVHQNRQVALNLLNNLAVRLRTMDQTFVMELGRSALASKSKLDKLNTLIEATKIVNSAIDLDTLLRLILDVAARSIAADRGTLYLVDHNTEELWSKIAQGNGMIEIRLPMGKGLAGFVGRTGQVVNITDAYRDTRFNPEIDRKSGYTTHTVLCMPMRNKEGTIVGVFQFLNKRTGLFGPEDEAFIDALSVHAAMAIENARVALEMVQNERLTAIGRMAATILHDIKNPMATLRLYAGQIKRKTASPDEARMADEMIRQVDRLTTMTEEILDFARGVSQVHLDTVQLGGVFQRILPFLETDLNTRKIALVRAFDYTGSCLLDVEKFTRVMYNLTGNAADAMPEGGTLTIRTRTVDTLLAVEVTDTGIGIPEDIRSHLFEPFFTHGKKHGTGLGLSIVRKIIEDHHGRVEVESVPGSGSTFRILFPLPHS
jgi:signal transduction histidine kinase/CRP-like cAMP-binding protein